MSEITLFNWNINSQNAFAGRQAAREQRHREYLQRQAGREQRHGEYLGRQAAREQRNEEYLERQATREQRHEEYLERQAAREARQQGYFDRVQENTSRYRARYEEMLADLVRQGLEQYMPGEFAQVRHRLAELDDLLDSDPAMARDLSLQLGAELSRLPAIAREARRELETRERQRQQDLSEMQKRATSELAQFIQSQLAKISDPIEQDFAFDRIKALQLEYAGRKVSDLELPILKKEILAKTLVIREDSTTKAKAWKDRKSQESIRETQTLLLEIHKEQSEAEVSHNPKATQSMLASLDAMRQHIAGQGFTMDDLQKQLAAETEKTDKTVVDENCRRMVVRAIMDSLEKTGFVVSNPQRQIGDQDEVVILAKKPAGAEASFRVTAEGKMEYKFDHYEGMKCKSDIDQILPMLQEIYGVELSDTRTLWQNPDRISKSAKPSDTGSKEQRHGQ